MAPDNTPLERKILVAVDGSIYSRHAVNYLARLFSGVESIHFHLLSVVQAGNLPASREWMSQEEIVTAGGSAVRAKIDAANRYLKEMAALLARAGIKPEQVTTEVALSRSTVAQDILHQARKGIYDALLLGRRGITKIEELFMGSVSATLLDKCHDVPLWIIDGDVDSRKFLVPVDGTVHSLLAVDHLAHILHDNPHAEITLFHSQAMLAGRTEIKPEEFHELWDKEWCDLHLTREDSLFHAPRQLLIESGFPEERIFWLQTFKGFDPSRQILRQALIDGFGTIVMGRRDGSINKGIFKGVTDRVLFMAEEVAVWVVG